MHLKYTKYAFSICLIANCYANNIHHIKHKIQTKVNTDGNVQAGTWFNLDLQSVVQNAQGTQQFRAITVEPIYNKDYSAILIPAKATVNGSYINNGSTCSFSINKISFKDTDVELNPGAYSTVNASLPNQAPCNPELTYTTGQLLEFQTKVIIGDLLPVSINNDYQVLNTPYSFAQAEGNKDYIVKNITTFTNGLMKLDVEFHNQSIEDKLVPIYYDRYGLSHFINFTIVTNNQENLNSSNLRSYLILSYYLDFGFGLRD